MSVTFGKRVVGEQAHAEAVKKAAGGAEVFGKRVLGSIPEPNVELIAKRNSEFGPRTTEGAHQSDPSGKEGTISVEDIESILDENPTFFDSLYENELALPTGPRKAALQIFALVEQGIKGAGRKHVLDEINALLGNNNVTNAMKGANIEAQQEQIRQAGERNEENKLLRDAPRVRALKQRDEDITAVRGAKNRGTENQLVGSDVDGQVAKIQGDKGKGGDSPLPEGVAAAAQGDDLPADHRKETKARKAKKRSRKR